MQLWSCQPVTRTTVGVRCGQTNERASDKEIERESERGVDRRARQRCSSKPKDLLGPVSRVKKKKRRVT